MSRSSIFLSSLGVQIDPAAKKVVALASRRIRTPTYHGGSNVEPSRVEAADDGNAGAFLSFAVFLCLTHLRLIARDTPRGKIVLEGGKRSPAYSLYYAINNNKLGWLNKLLFGAKNRSEFSENHIVRYSDHGNYFIGWKHSIAPNIHIFKTPKLNSIIKMDDLDLGMDEIDNEEIWACVSSILKTVNISESTAVSASNWIDWHLLPLVKPPSKNEKSASHDSCELNRRAIPRSSIWHSITLPFGGTFPVNELYCELQIRKSALTLSKSNLEDGCVGVSNFLQNIQRFTIITGDAGSGKSTLIKQILSVHESHERKTPMPAMVFRLSEIFSQDHSEINSPKTHEEMACWAIEGKLRSVENLLDKELDHLLIFDGIDELPSAYQRSICDLLSELSWRHTVIATSRPIPATKFCTADQYNIAPLSRMSKIELVTNICKTLKFEYDPKAILYKIQKNSKYISMSENPFFLSILCILLIENHNSSSGDYSSNSIIKTAIDQILDDLESPTPKIENWRIFCHQAFLYTPAGQGEIQNGYVIKHSELFTRSKLGSISKTTGHFEFSHQKIKEFLAGMHIAEMSDVNLANLLDHYGLSSDIREEWKVAMRAIAPSSRKGAIIQSWWIHRLSNPDLFGGIFCIAAEILAEWDLHNGGIHLFGMDLYSQLWNNLDKNQWPLRSAQALVALDVSTYAKDLRDRLTSNEFTKQLPEAVFRFSQRAIPLDIQEEFNVLPLLNRRNLETLFTPDENVSILPIENIDNYRAIVRNRDLLLSERSEALFALMGHQDRFILDDADYIFQEIPETFESNYYNYLYSNFCLLHITIRSVAINAPPRDAARFLFKKLMYYFEIQESFGGRETFLTQYLVFALRDGYGTALSKEIGPDIVKILSESRHSNKVLNFLTIILSYAKIDGESIRLVSQNVSIKWEHILTLHQRSNDQDIINDLIARSIKSGEDYWLDFIKSSSRMPINPKNFSSLINKNQGKKFLGSLRILKFLRQFNLSEFQHRAIDHSIIDLLEQQSRGGNDSGFAKENLLFLVSGMSQATKAQLNEVLINRIVSKRFDYTLDLEALACTIAEDSFNRMWDFINNQEGTPCQVWGMSFAHVLVRSSPAKSLEFFQLANSDLKKALTIQLSQWTENADFLYFPQSSNCN